MAGVAVVRAFRGTRRSSVYREHVVPGGAFDRILSAAVAADLPLLSALGGSVPHELDKHSSRRLADEVSRLRVAATVLELDSDLVALAALASWCARATEDAWLRVEPR